MTESDAKDNLDALTEAHEQVLQPSNGKDDILAAAQLFNTVGSELTKVQKHKVDGHDLAMKLDKSKVFSEQVDDHYPAPQATSSVSVPVEHAPVASQSITPRPVSNTPAHTTINLGVKEYEQQKKAVSGIKRKLSKLEKQVNELAEVMSHESKQTAYLLTTSNVQVKCSNTTTLLRMLATELQSGPVSITIERC